MPMAPWDLSRIPGGSGGGYRRRGVHRDQNVFVLYAEPSQRSAAGRIHPFGIRRRDGQSVWHAARKPHAGVRHEAHHQVHGG